MKCFEGIHGTKKRSFLSVLLHLNSRDPQTIGINPNSSSYNRIPSTLLLHSPNYVQKEERAPTSKPWELVNQELKFKTNALSCGGLPAQPPLSLCSFVISCRPLQDPLLHPSRLHPSKGLQSPAPPPQGEVGGEGTL